MRKTYIVAYMKNGDCITKAYKNRKSVEKYAIKVIEEEMTTITIDTYIDGKCVDTERY